MTGNYNDLVADILGTGNSLTATAVGGNYNDFNFTIDALFKVKAKIIGIC